MAKAIRQGRSRLTLIEPLGFEAALARAQSLMQQAPFDYFEAGKSLPEAELLYAMVYALDGGKALRAFLVIESARLHGQGLEAGTRAGLAVECIHAYSLIHDDLPCMDDDDLRRGKPTVHKKWNEHGMYATAAKIIVSSMQINSLALSFTFDFDEVVSGLLYTQNELSSIGTAYFELECIYQDQSGRQHTTATI